MMGAHIFEEGGIRVVEQDGEGVFAEIVAQLDQGIVFGAGGQRIVGQHWRIVEIYPG